MVEPSAGADRATLAFLVDAYHEEPDKDETRVVLRFHPEIAPVKVAVLPLSRKEPLTALAKELSQELRRYWNTEYDDAKSIGRRYRRQDEIDPFVLRWTSGSRGPDRDGPSGIPWRRPAFPWRNSCPSSGRN